MPVGAVVALDHGCRHQVTDGALLAGQLISDLLTLLHDREKTEVFYLWSDIKPEYYRKFGFVALPDESKYVRSNSQRSGSRSAWEKNRLANPCVVAAKQRV